MFICTAIVEISTCVLITYYYDVSSYVTETARLCDVSLYIVASYSGTGRSKYDLNLFKMEGLCYA